MDNLRAATEGSEPMAAYASGWLDGLLWMLYNGAEEGQHLRDHVKAGETDVVWDLALQAMTLVFLHYPDVWTYVAGGADLVKDMSALRPPCAGPPSPHLGPQWLKPPSPN